MPVLSSSLSDGGKVKLVGSTPVFGDFESFSEFVCTGDKGANFGEERVNEAGGGVDNDTLEGVLPAAAFFSICSRELISMTTHILKS